MSSKTTRFESLLEAVPDALVGMDQKGAIRFVNHQTESLFGYGRDNLVGQPIQTLVPEYLWEGGYPFHCPRGATPLLLVVNGRRCHNGWGSGTASWCLGAVKWIPPSAQIDAWKSFPARCDSVEPSQSMSSGRDVMRPPERPAQPRADRACSPCGACQVCTGEGSGARRCDSQPVGILRAAAVQSRGGFFGSRSSTPLKGPGVDFDST